MWFNLPNLITLIRVIIIPFFVYFIIYDDYIYRLIGFFLFIVGAFTDLLDGYIARKRKETTDFGKFFDPLADKLLVISALIVFFILPDTFIPLWMIIIIISRDVLITLMRILAKIKGENFKTSNIGKLKTFFQISGIVLVLAIIVIRSYLMKKYNINLPYDDFLKNSSLNEIISYILLYPFRGSIIVIPYVLMFFITIFTLYSGIKYIVKYWRLLLPPYNSKLNDR